MFDRVTVAVNGTTIWQNASSPAGGLDHIDREWRFVDLEVPPGMTSITWTLAADDSLDFGGWNIDDVCLVGVGKHAVCGDAIVDDGEQCDRSEGCAIDCTLEDTGCCSAGGDPAGSLVLGLGLLFVLHRRREPLL